MKIPAEKLKETAKNLKKPKVLALGILLATIAIAVLVLNMLAKRNKENPFFPASNPFRPPKTSIDPELQSVAEKIDAYNSKLVNLKNFKEELIYPIVDLDISF